jgi:hypothetical protein
VEKAARKLANELLLFFKKLPNINKRPTGENSTNLVTLLCRATPEVTDFLELFYFITPDVTSDRFF